jgi:hypothetical protein
MAIGSILTIAAYLAYEVYEYRQIAKEIKEDEESSRKMVDIILRYQQLVKEALLRGDNEDQIRDLIMERARAMARMASYGAEDITDLGPLPRIPEGHRLYGSEKINDQETLVLMPPQPSPEELKEFDIEAKRSGLGERVIDDPVYTVLVTVNATAEDLGVQDDDKEKDSMMGVPVNPNESKFNEVLWRTGFMIDELCRKGTLEADRSTMVMFLLRDDVCMYTYRKGSYQLVVFQWQRPDSTLE